MYYLKPPMVVHVFELLMIRVSSFLQGQTYLLTDHSIFYGETHHPLKAFSPLKVISVAFKKHPLLPFQGVLFSLGVTIGLITFAYQEAWA